MTMSASTLWLDRAKVYAALVLVGAGYGGYFVLTKASLSGGVDPFVFSTYRDGIGSLSLFMYALCFERGHWPAMSLKVAGLILAMAIFGIYVQQALFLIGLAYTDVIFSSLVLNCIPVTTFGFSVLFGNEEFSPRRRDGQAKVLGILCVIIGATILTLYKGPPIFGSSSPGPNLSSVIQRGWEIDERKLGALCLFGCCSGVGLLFNIQVAAMRRFPASFTLMSLTTLVATPLFAATAAFRVGLEPSEWILPPGPDLVAAIYAGTVASGICLFLSCWVSHKGGPTLMAAFTPMHTVFSIIFGVLILGNAIFLGSLFGAIAILCGLFLVTWGVREGLRLRALSLQIPTHEKHNEADGASEPTESLLVEPFLA